MMLNAKLIFDLAREPHTGLALSWCGKEQTLMTNLKNIVCTLLVEATANTVLSGIVFVNVVAFLAAFFVAVTNFASVLAIFALAVVFDVVASVIGAVT